MFPGGSEQTALLELTQVSQSHTMRDLVDWVSALEMEGAFASVEKVLIDLLLESD